MPLTPKFQLSQTKSQLTITIHVPHVRVSSSTIELIVDGYDMHFYSHPYLLFLTFPGLLVDDFETDREAKATYDPVREHGMLIVSIWKEEETLWEDLDFLGRLMQPADSPVTGHTKITVVSATTSMHEEDENHTTSMHEEDCNTPPTRNFFHDIKSTLRPHYGFLNHYHSVFVAYTRDNLSHDMLELPNPDETLAEDRRMMRLERESTKMHMGRYVGDLYLSMGEDEDSVYSEAMSMVPHWDRDTSIELERLTRSMHNLSTDNDREPVNFFTNEESHQLALIILNLPDNINEQSHSLLLSLMDILYAYAYDHRTTSGEPTCESTWTIAILSPTLSWLEQYIPPYDDVLSVIRWSIRRSLMYPYIRNYTLGITLVNDILKILECGPRTIIRCLLQVRTIFGSSDCYYLLNKLYIDPYIGWMQLIQKEVLNEFVQNVKHVLDKDGGLDKDTLGLNLEEIEREALRHSTHDSDSDVSGSGQYS